MRYAADLGLDVDRFREDLRRHVGAARVAEDVDSAGSSGVAGTPTFFINGRRQYGAYDSTPHRGGQDGKGTGEARRAGSSPARSTTSRLTPLRSEPEAAPRGSIAGGRPQSSSGSAQCSRRSGSGGLTSDYGNRRLDAKAFGLVAALLVLTGAVLLWIRRRSWTDHNVSDPGVTL